MITVRDTTMKSSSVVPPQERVPAFRSVIVTTHCLHIFLDLPELSTWPLPTSRGGRVIHVLLDLLISLPPGSGHSA